MQMLQMKCFLLYGIYTFIFLRITEFFDDDRYFTHNQNDILKFHFWTRKFFSSENGNYLVKHILCHYSSCLILVFSFNLILQLQNRPALMENLLSYGTDNLFLQKMFSFEPPFINTFFFYP